MKYTQEQVLKYTSEYGLSVYFAYVEEAQEYYHSFMENYLASVGYMMLWSETPKKTILKEAHKFCLAATGLVFPPILCKQIDILFNINQTTS